MNGVQAAILMVFNETESVSFQDIIDRLGISEPIALQALQKLCAPKN